MTKSLSDLLRSLDTNNQDVHQSVLKLARACSATEPVDQTVGEARDESWINFIELVVSNLCFGDQQHFYNLGMWRKRLDSTLFFISALEIQLYNYTFIIKIYYTNSQHISTGCSHVCLT